MFERRLLSRISDSEEARQRRPDLNDILADVLSHLRELFNIRKGSVSIRSDYGMVDLNSALGSFTDAIPLLEAEIASQISKFEPRLNHVNVRYTPDKDKPGTIGFAIHVVLETPDGGRKIKVDTQISQNGQVRISQ